MIEPTSEFKIGITDAQRAALQERKILAVAFHRMAQTDDGKRVLAYLEAFTNRPVPLEQLPHGAVHKEGQRWLIHEIHTQVAQGERYLASKT